MVVKLLVFGFEKAQRADPPGIGPEQFLRLSAEIGGKTAPAFAWPSAIGAERYAAPKR